MLNDNAARKRASNLVLQEVYKEYKMLALGGLAMFASSYSNQAVPKFIGRLIDQSSTQDTTDGRKSLLIDFLCISLIGGLSSFIRTSVLGYVHENIASRLRQTVFEHIMDDVDLEGFLTESSVESKSGTETYSGDIDKKEDRLSKGWNSPAMVSIILKDDVNSVCKTVTSTSAGLVRSLSSCVFATANMLMLNANLVALTVLTAPIVGSLALLTRRRMKELVALQENTLLEVAAFTEERIEHIEMVKLAGRGTDEVENYKKLQERIAHLGQRAALASGFSMGSMFLMSTGSLCCILYQGGLTVKRKAMNHGDLVSFGTYSFLLALGSAGIVRGMSEFSRGIDAAERVVKLLDAKEKASSASPVPKVADLQIDPVDVQGISVDNVNFAYASDPSRMVLENVSISLPRGKVVMVAGKNGSGKTTLSKILAGVFRPTSGKIVLHTREHDHDYLKEFNLEEKAQLLQFMMQNQCLLNHSILENVRYTKPEASEEEVRAVLEAANFNESMFANQGGLNFIVGRNGRNLSGGQRQRICLARALLRSPLFLVLDEPTSALDEDGQSAVSDAIAACRSANRSLLVITHSPQTLELADHIVVLADGAVVEQGSLGELKTKNGYLCELMPSLARESAA